MTLLNFWYYMSVGAVHGSDHAIMHASM